MRCNSKTTQYSNNYFFQKICQCTRAKIKTMESLGLRRGIEDILITLGDQYHLIRLVPNNQGLFLYLVLDKAKGNLALARYKLTDIERTLKV